MTSADVPSRAGDTSSLPKFMPPVTLDSLEPHPYLPFQPDRRQFIILPEVGEGSAVAGPKDILVAAKSGALAWVKRFVAMGQTELQDSMGEVRT
jgi:hypothetical protein